MTQRYPHWLWMLPILLLTASLSIVHFNDDAIWFDEWVTYFISGGGKFQTTVVTGSVCDGLGIGAHTVAHTLCLAAIDNSWPPEFFLLLSGWNLVSLGNPVVDRALAFFIGMLAVSLMYPLGKKLLNRDLALMSAALLGTSAFFIHYLHEVRGYSLYVFTAALSAFFYWLILNSKIRYKRWVRWGFVLSIAGALYAHYIGIAVVCGIMAYHILFERPPRIFGTVQVGEGAARKRFWDIFRLWLNGCLFYAPWIGVLIISVINESITQRSVSTFVLLQGMVYGFSNNLSIFTLIVIMIGIVRWREKPIRFLWIWGLAILTVAILANIFANFLFHPRHIIGMMPAFALLVAAGLGVIWRYQKWISVLFVGAWIGAGIINSATPTFMNLIPRQISPIPMTSINAIYDKLDRCIPFDDALVLSIDEPVDAWVYDLPMEYYFDDYISRLTHLSLLVTNEVSHDSRLIPEPLEEDSSPFSDRIDYITDGMERVWLFSLPTLAVQDDLLRFDRLMSEAGFVGCDPVIDQPDIMGTVYTRDVSQCVTFIQTCNGE